MPDPENPLSDDGWTGDLVPPLNDAQPVEPNPPAPKDPEPDHQGLMIDVYSVE